MEIGSGSAPGSGSDHDRDDQQRDQDELNIETILSSYKKSRLCTVCQEPVLVVSMRSIAILKCKHVYHLDCIGSAYNFKNAMECPTCRDQESGEWRYAAGGHSGTGAHDAMAHGLQLEPYEVQPVQVGNWNQYLGLGPLDPLLRGNRPNPQRSNPLQGEATREGSGHHNRAQQAPPTDVMNNLFTGYGSPPRPPFPIRQSSTEHQNTSSLYEAILGQQGLDAVFPVRENVDHDTFEVSLGIPRDEAVQQDFPFTQPHTSLIGASTRSRMGGTSNHHRQNINYSLSRDPAPSLAGQHINNYNLLWEPAPSLAIPPPPSISAHGSAQARRIIVHQGSSIFASQHFARIPRRAASGDSVTSSTQSNDTVQPASSTAAATRNLAPRSTPAERPE